MYEFIESYAIAITQYGCLIIYALALSVGFLQIILWLTEQFIIRTIGLHDFYRGFQYYLKKRAKTLPDKPKE